jgi:hypothetical protein
MLLKIIRRAFCKVKTCATVLLHGTSTSVTLLLNPITITFVQVDADPKFEGVDHIVLSIIVYMDKTTLDGLGRTSCYPLYLSLANFSWEVYNEQHGMVLCALLPCPVADADWPHVTVHRLDDIVARTRTCYIDSTLR